MAALALDTHAVVKELTSTGLSEPQAEAITSAVGRLRQFDLEDLATKADLATIRNDMATKADLAALRSELKSDFADFKAEMARCMFGQTIVTLGAVAAIIKLLH